MLVHNADDDLVRLTRKAFGRGGIVEQIKGGHRPKQEEYAIQLAKWMSMRTNDARAIVTLAHVAPGVGKTLAYLVVLALHICLNPGHRSIVTTFTRSLRSEIIEEEMVVNTILARISEHEGLSEPWHISIGARVSFTSLASYERANDLVALAFDPSDPWPAVLQEKAKQYRDEIVAKYAAVGELPLLSDWLEREGRIPHVDSDKASPASFVMTYEERLAISQDKNHPAWAVVNYLNESNKIATGSREHSGTDILVVTHAMFVMNGIEFGTLMKTSRKEGFGPFSVLADEADLLLEQGSNALDLHLTIHFMQKVSEKIGCIKDFRTFKKELNAIRKKCGSHSICYINTDDVQRSYVDSLRKFGAAIAKKNDYVDDYDDHLTAEYLRSSLERMMAVITHLDGRMSAFSTIVEAAKVYNRIEGGKEIAALTLRADKPENVVSKAWRAYNTHAFTHVNFVSGSLLDTKGQFGNFAKNIRVYLPSDQPRVESPLRTETPIEIHSDRRIASLVLCGGNDFRSIKPSLSEGVEVLGENQSLDFTNPAHVGFVGRAIYHNIIAKQDQTKTLVLMSSYQALGHMKRHFEDYPDHERFASRLIFQDRGAGAAADVKRTRDTRGAIVFGLNWQGVNYVADNKTIIGRVILFKLPFKAGADFSDQNYAMRKAQQGIARALRFDHDRPEIWIMDNRLPPLGSGLKGANMVESLFRGYTVENKYRFRSVDDPIIVSL